eukprot:COSAG06_NODE_576_length_14051_cov_5.354644_4_plen_610_part_00
MHAVTRRAAQRVRTDTTQAYKTARRWRAAACPPRPLANATRVRRRSRHMQQQHVQRTSSEGVYVPLATADDGAVELPPGWTQKRMRTGKVIYENASTGTTQYEVPQSAPSSAAEPQVEREEMPSRDELLKENAELRQLLSSARAVANEEGGLVVLFEKKPLRVASSAQGSLLAEQIAEADDEEGDGNTGSLSRQDTDAVLPELPELAVFGRLLCGAERGEMSTFSYALHLYMATFGLVVLFWTTPAFADCAGDPDGEKGAKNTLLNTFGPCIFGLYSVGPSFAMADLLNVLGASGTLEQLDASNVRVSEDDAATLGWWRMFWKSYTLYWIFMACAFDIPNAYISYQDGTFKGVTWWGMLTGTWFVVFPCVYYAWPMSMCLASTIARDAITEVRQVFIHSRLNSLKCGCVNDKTLLRQVIEDAKITSPLDDAEWNRKVVGPIVALSGMMDKLSDGWSRGLIWITIGNWSAAIGTSLWAMNDKYTRVASKHQTSYYCGATDDWTTWPICVFLDEYFSTAVACVFTVILVISPFAFGWDLAETSTRADDLTNTLNDVRAKYINSHPGALSASLSRVETYMDRLHFGQGLCVKAHLSDAFVTSLVISQENQNL